MSFEDLNFEDLNTALLLALGPDLPINDLRAIIDDDLQTVREAAAMKKRKLPEGLLLYDDVDVAATFVHPGSKGACRKSSKRLLKV